MREEVHILETDEDAEQFYLAPSPENQKRADLLLDLFVALENQPQELS